MKKHPNIVYLHSHDTGRYIQPYGYAVETPNMQRFAEEGVLFRNAFCAAPTCAPRPGMIVQSGDKTRPGRVPAEAIILEN
jgi:arylsulfatase A-like enzyme